MKRILPLIALTAAFVGCETYEDPTEKAVRSQAPMSESTGATTKDLNQRQTNDVDGMADAGLMNKYEEEQMESAIGTTK